MQSAGRAQEEFGVKIVVIKKTSPEYGMEKDPPPCPSVVVNGRVIAKNDIVTYEAVTAAILNTGEL
jgi:hypothetical protein